MAVHERRVDKLHGLLADMKKGALVAFSGGVDSTVLLAEAHTILGDRCKAVTADSPSLPRAALAWAAEFCRNRGISHRVVETHELDDPRYAANTADRCFFCKSALFTAMQSIAWSVDLPNLLYGAIADDLGDWRPGMTAAADFGARAPLLDAGFTKKDVRMRARVLGLPGWDKPSSACLASRFPTGMTVTLENLRRVEAAEAVLHRLGFRQCRVRLIGDSARIEVERAALARLMDAPTRKAILTELKTLGFRFITLDLEGFRSGSLSPHSSGD
ncbi:MAG: ATP-dependent sacrificial sulfur transferase LarE [Acidobacteriota bacterium]